MSEKKYEDLVSVDRAALVKLLRAVKVNHTHGHLLREMLATRALDSDNPIDKLTANIEKNSKPRWCCDAARSSRGWHHSPSCSNWVVKY